MLENGADIRVIQELLGHEDITILANLYAGIAGFIDQDLSGYAPCGLMWAEIEGLPYP